MIITIRTFLDPVNESASIIFITENDIQRVSFNGDLFNKSQRSLVSSWLLQQTSITF